jgi:hypothetical protein
VLGIPTAIQVLPAPDHLGTEFATNVGDPVFFMWQLTTQTHHLLSPMQGNIFYPHTDVMAYANPLLSFLPVFAPALRITGENPVAAYNAVAFIGYLGGALAAYWLAVRLLGDRAAALVAALLFTISPYRTAAVSHIELAAFAYAIVCFIFVMRFLEQRRLSDALLAGIFAGLTWLGSLYCAMMLALSLGAFLIVWALQQWAWSRQRLRVFGKRLLLGLGIAVAAAAVLSLPTLSAYVHIAQTGAITRAASELITVKPSSFTSFPATVFYRWLGLGGETPDIFALYPGTILLALLATAAAFAFRHIARVIHARQARVPRAVQNQDPAALRRRDYALPILAVLLVSGFVLIGPNRNIFLSLPDRLLRSLVPGVANLRDLTRFWLVWTIVLAIAGGFGFRLMTRRLNPRMRIATGIIVVALAGIELVYSHTMASVAYSGDAILANKVLTRLPPGPVMEAPLPTVLTFGYDFTVAPEQLRSTIDGNDRVEGYSGSVPADVEYTITVVNRLPEPAALDYLRSHGVRYLVLHGAPVACDGRFSIDEMTQLVNGMMKQPGAVTQVISAGNDRVVELSPLRGPAGALNAQGPPVRAAPPCAYG